MHTYETLIRTIKNMALEIKPDGEFFTLKNGGKSKFYLDCRKLTWNGDGLQQAVWAINHKLEELGLVRISNLIYVNHGAFNAIGGPCVGADALIGGLLAHMVPNASLTSIRGFGVRKEEKNHGKAGRVFGSILPGDRCVMIEDVTTTGGSSLDAIDAVEAYGANVIMVISIVDRLSGATEAFAARGIPFYPLVTILDLGVNP